MSINVYCHLPNSTLLIKLADKPISASGGEGTVYVVDSDGAFSGKCVKIYHESKRTSLRLEKLLFMIKNAPAVRLPQRFMVCWPLAVVFDECNKFCGFIMPLAFPFSKSLYDFTRSTTYKGSDPNWLSLFGLETSKGSINRLKICLNIAVAINSIHEIGITLVDYKPQNILIENSGKVSIIDLDSCQITVNGKVLYFAEAWTIEYSPPESKNVNLRNTVISETWDRFSIAVSFYEILFGIHPYTATPNISYSNIHTIGDKILNGLFVHGSKRQSLELIPKHHNVFNELPDELKSLFCRAFDSVKYKISDRPSAAEWGQVLYDVLTKKKSGIQNRIRKRIIANKIGDIPREILRIVYSCYKIFTNKKTHAEALARFKRSASKLKKVTQVTFKKAYLIYELGANKFTQIRTRVKEIVNITAKILQIILRIFSK